jgi:hypothetical protein
VWIIPPSMSSPCVQEEEDSTLGLEWRCQMLAQHAMWRGKSIPSRYWRRVCKTNSWMQHLAGLISPPLMANRGAESWIASLVAIRASRSQQPESVSEKVTPDISGPTSPESLVRSSQSGASLRTSGDISASASSRSGETFADLVTRLKLDYSVRRKSVLPTSENGSTSWPTPRASPNENRTTRPTPSQENGQHGKYLAGEVQRCWPTAAARDWKSGKASPATLTKNARPLNEAVQAQDGGKLNPEWVCLLQGYPPNWEKAD